MTELAALIWDVDGTLAETERDGHRVAFNRAFTDAGLDWHWSPTKYGELLRVTGGKERLRHYWSEIEPIGAAGPHSAQRIAALHARKTEHYLAAVQTGAIALRPGVVRLLDQARAAGVRLAIATTTTEDNVRALLARTLGSAAAAWFEVIGAGDVVARKKPAADIYLWVLERLRLGAQQCLAIEDSAAGAAAARAAGIAVVVTRSAYTRDESVSAVADLDGLGDALAPAEGTALGHSVRLVVGLADLRRWHALAYPSSQSLAEH